MCVCVEKERKIKQMLTFGDCDFMRVLCTFLATF